MKPNETVDTVDELEVKFNTPEEYYTYFRSKSFVDYLTKKYGTNIPRFFVGHNPNADKAKQIYPFLFLINPSKRGIPMDFDLFSGHVPITPERIKQEENIEKRRLLIMEYGVNNFFKNQEVIQKDAYGELIKAEVDGDINYFAKVINGTTESDPELISYLKEKNALTSDNRKIYYLAIPSLDADIPIMKSLKEIESDDDYIEEIQVGTFRITTARAAVAWSWGLIEEDLPIDGWDYES